MRASVENVFPGPFRKLENLLWKWILLNREMIKFWDGKDCPWWYNERASISTFAGAVWNAGGIVLEEYASRKRKGRRNALGRCDLYFTIEHKEYVAEAKQWWLNAGSRARHMDVNVRKCLDEACEDSKQNRPEHQGGETIIGIAFIVPRIPQSDLENEVVGERIKEVQDVLIEIAKKEKCALAWVFPRGSRKLEAEDDNYIYPGAAVMIKQVQQKA